LELINIIWLPESSSFNLDKLIRQNKDKKDWREDICKFEVVKSYPNALSAWIPGNGNTEILDDKIIALECTKLLRKFLNNPNIPEPKHIVRSKWDTNIYTRGTYSHLPLGSTNKDFSIIAEPIPSESVILKKF
jgi:spermine oxidase